MVGLGCAEELGLVDGDLVGSGDVVGSTLCDGLGSWLGLELTLGEGETDALGEALTVGDGGAVVGVPVGEAVVGVTVGDDVSVGDGPGESDSLGLGDGDDTLTLKLSVLVQLFSKSADVETQTLYSPPLLGVSPKAGSCTGPKVPLVTATSLTAEAGYVGEPSGPVTRMKTFVTSPR